VSNTLKLIERVRSKTETGTDYAVAKALGMNQSNLRRILKGKSFPGDKARRQMVDLLPDVTLSDVVALINEDKAQSEADRAYWRSLCAASVRAWLDSATAIAASLIAVVPVLMFLAIHYAKRLSGKFAGGLLPPKIGHQCPKRFGQGKKVKPRAERHRGLMAQLAAGCTARALDNNRPPASNRRCPPSSEPNTHEWSYQSACLAG
jgi:hypothetical protein